jgi:DNA-binding NarL/FixJ family response regulator
MCARVFIVEDGAAVQDRLRRAIEETDRTRLAGIADNEADAIAGILDSAPDLVILDLQLRRGNGLRVLEAIRTQGCSAFVVVQTNFALPEYRARCMRLGADRFLDKTEDAPRLLDLIAEVAARLPGGDRSPAEPGA